MAVSVEYKTRVMYACSCSQLSPLGELYFCRHCKVARCPDCVSSTIDSFSCPHCFENAPLTEAKNRKNRCNHCFQCPQCTSTLITRSIIVPSEVLGDQSPQKAHQQLTEEGASPGTPRTLRTASSSVKSPGGTKAYFLSCTHCKWNTRDVNAKDKRSPIDFKDRPSPHQERIAELVSFYKEFSLRDKAEREKVKKTSRRMRSYGSLLDPSKFTARIQGSESPTQPRRGSSQIMWDPSLPERMAAKATDSPKPPPDDLYSVPLKLEEIPTLQQRFLDPAHQPTSSDEFWPRPLALIGKKLHRCKGCDHILLKAEMNPASIRFKIQQIALHTFPQVRIVEPPKMTVATPCEVLLSVTNPVNYLVTVSFEPCSPDFLMHLKESPVSVTLPSGEFVLTPNDDVGDLLEGVDGDSEIEDNPEFVHSRLPGKLILKFTVIPDSSTEDTKFVFLMKFTHKSTVETDKENEICTVSVPVLVNVGHAA